MLIIGQVSGKDVYEQQFELSFGRDVPFQSNYFIERLAKAWIITHQNDNVFKQVHQWKSRKTILNYNKLADKYFATKIKSIHGIDGFRGKGVASAWTGLRKIP